MKDQSWKRNNLTRNIILVVVSLIAAAGIIVAYVQYDQKNAYIEKTTAENVSREKRIMESYDRIESNLAKINQHESMIQQDMAGAENTSNLAPEERIQYEIDMIEQLISENNRIIAALHDQINEKDTRLASYERTVKDLKARVTEYHAMVDALVADKEALQKNLDETILVRDNLQVEVSNLNSDVAHKTGLIADQKQMLLEKERDLHTAYYAVGTYKSLRDRNIVDKEGGFLGINQVKILTNDLENEKFKEIDTREVTVIPVDAKKCEIVTDQDPSSYTILYSNDKVNSIKIIDAEKFWKKSKYLVIVVRESNYDEVAASR